MSNNLELFSNNYFIILENSTDVHVACIVIPKKTSIQTNILPKNPKAIISPYPTVLKVIMEKYQASI